MTRNIAFEGFVVKKSQMLDASYVVTLFTKSNGKIAMIAKGVKKITSKRASHLQTGNKLKLDATKHVSGVWYLGSTSLLTGISTIKDSAEKSAALYIALQLIDVLIPEDIEERYVYAAFSQFLVRLSHADIDTRQLTLGFARILIGHLGFGTDRASDFTELKKVIQEISGREIDFQMI